MSQSNFKHTTARVPRLYKEAGRIVQKVRLEGGSFKGLVYQTRHKCIKSLYALVAETLRHGSELDTLLRRTKLLLKEPRLDPWLARVLITEMLWRQRALSGPAMPLKIVNNYKAELLSEQTALTTEKSKSGTRAARPRFVRVNTLKTTTDTIKRNFTFIGWKEVELVDSNLTNDHVKYSSFLKRVNSLADNEFIQDLHIPDLLIFPQNLEFYELNEYRDSSLILQDKASCLSAYFLDAPTGSTVLDMCAAPGMKTTHAAASLANTGRVYAIEKHSGRYESLCKIVRASGATCVEPILGDALQFSFKEIPHVEYIIVDPSCSGSGMINREDVFHDSKDVSKERLEKLSGFQCALLRRAMTHFPEAKRIVYSTCSLFPEENEAVIEAVLNSTPPNFVPVQSPRNTNWLKEGSSSYKYGSYGLYTQPQVDLTNGFFIAVFERSENEYVLAEKFLSRNVVTDKPLPINITKKKKGKKNKTIVQAHGDPPRDVPEDNDNQAFEKLKKAMQSLCKANLEEEPVTNRTDLDTSEIHPTQDAEQNGWLGLTSNGVQNKIETNFSKKQKKRKRKESDADIAANLTPQETDIQSEIVFNEVIQSHCKKQKKRKRKHSIDYKDSILAERDVLEK